MCGKVRDSMSGSERLRVFPRYAKYLTIPNEVRLEIKYIKSNSNILDVTLLTLHHSSHEPLLNAQSQTPKSAINHFFSHPLFPWKTKYQWRQWPSFTLHSEGMQKKILSLS